MKQLKPNGGRAKFSIQLNMIYLPQGAQFVTFVSLKPLSWGHPPYV